MARLSEGSGGTIAKAAAPERGARFLFDEHRDAPTGFGLRITAAGTKAFVLRYTAPGAVRTLTIGRWPAWSLARARERANTLRREIDAGADPLAEKRAARASTFGALLDEYDREKLAQLKSGREVRRALDRVLTEKSWGATGWRERGAATITPQEIKTLLRKIASDAPIMANRTLAYLRAFFNWTAGEGVLASSPTAGIKPRSEETSRDRVLTGAEIALFWQATEQLGYPFGPLYRVLLLTGARLREVAELTASEITGDTWTLPRTRSKNGRENAVPLSAPVRELLAGLPAADYLFTRTGKTPASGFSKAQARLLRIMGEIAGEPVEPFVIHDLRRTAATGLAALGVPIHVTEAILNHKSGTVSGVAAIYNRHDYAAEKRQALDEWGRHVLGLIEPRDNVVALRRG